MRGAIHHLDLTVKDPWASCAFYDAVLGFMGYRRVREDARGLDWEKMLPEGGLVSIGLMKAEGAGKLQTPEVAAAIDEMLKFYTIAPQRIVQSIKTIGEWRRRERIMDGTDTFASKSEIIAGVRFEWTIADRSSPEFMRASYFVDGEAVDIGTYYDRRVEAENADAAEVAAEKMLNDIADDPRLLWRLAQLLADRGQGELRDALAT